MTVVSWGRLGFFFGRFVIRSVVHGFREFDFGSLDSPDVATRSNETYIRPLISAVNPRLSRCV